MNPQNAGVSVTPQAIVQALHASYGRTIGQLHQENAELSAALDAVTAERDQYRGHLEQAASDAGLPGHGLDGVPPGHGVFRQEGQPDQYVPLHGMAPADFTGDPLAGAPLDAGDQSIPLDSQGRERFDRA